MTVLLVNDFLVSKTAMEFSVFLEKKKLREPEYSPGGIDPCSRQKTLTNISHIRGSGFWIVSVRTDKQIHSGEEGESIQ